MTDTLRIKRRVTGLAGAPGGLANAELAYNEVDDTLYYGKGTGGTGGTASSIIPIGGNGLGDSTNLPLVNAAVALTGSRTVWSRSDHVHPTDGSRAPTANPSFTGLVTIGGTIGGTGMTLYFASPAAIGGTAAAAGTFTNLIATTSLSGAGVTALFASPPAIGGTAPAAGTFTNLTASGTVSGAGFTALLSGYATTGSVPLPNTVTTPIVDGTATIGSLATYARSDHIHPTDTSRAPTAGPVFTGLVNVTGTIGGAGMIAYFASPPAVGATTAGTGAFTTLAVSSTISGTGINALFAAPPGIGSTTAGTGAFTTLSATGTVSGLGFTNYLASPPAIGGTVAAAGTFTNLTASGTVSGAGFTALLSGYATTGSIPSASITVPLVDSGSGSVGTGTAYAISNHVHPTDTSRAAVNSPIFTGNPTSTTNPLAADSSQSLATTSWVKGLAYAPLASPAFTGNPTSTTNPAQADSSQSLATTAWVRALRQDQFQPPGADVSWGTNWKIINLHDPSGPQDAATKNYVDQNATGLSSKAAVVAATTANISLTPASFQVIDGYTTQLNDRILVKDQTTAANNGIYTVSTPPAAWVRATDMNTWPQVPQAYVFVSGGTVNSGSSWVCNSPVSGTLGTTAIVWVQFSQAAQTTAGNGLNKVGNTFNVVGTTNRITVGVAVDIAATYVGQTSITTLGTITGSAVWAATDIAVTAGGTGVSTLAAGYVKSSGTSPFTSVSTIPLADVNGWLSMAQQPSNNVTITGGTIDGVTFDMGSF